MGAARPLVGLVCCNEVADRAVQTVASRFLEPLSQLSGASVLLVPAMAHAIDPMALVGLFDGLLLTGSRSHVSPERYGAAADGSCRSVDHQRDTVALDLAGRMIDAGKPVFGICRGLQEINVLFGGSLSREACRGRHHRGAEAADFAALFEHRHTVDLTPDGLLAATTGQRRLTVNSVHEQCIDRLGTGLSVEALSSDDGLVEAIRAPSCDAEVLAVQWHPEWDAARDPASRAFFTLFGATLRGADRIGLPRQAA